MHTGRIPKITQAVIFAGGKGERLRPLTNDRPKPMVEVCGRPFLEHLIELLRENGIQDVLLLLGYLPEIITGHFGDGSRHGVRISYHIGAVEDLTGTRLRNASHLLKEYFLLLYCDNFWPLNLSKVWEEYRARGAPVMVTVYDNRMGGGEYGPLLANMTVDDDGFATFYGELTDERSRWGLDIGFCIVRRDIVPRVRSEVVWGNFMEELITRRELSAFVTRHPYCMMTDRLHLERTTRFLEHKKVIFLDRDGVINTRMPLHQYVRAWSELEFLPKAKEALALLAAKGYRIFIVTNQKGVARGHMTMGDVEGIHRRMTEAITHSGGSIAGVYVCPHDEGGGCGCRKPRPDLFYRAAHDHHLILSTAITVGDNESDIVAGEAAGCKTGILLSGGTTLYDVARRLP